VLRSFGGTGAAAAGVAMANTMPVSATRAIVVRTVPPVRTTIHGLFYSFMKFSTQLTMRRCTAAPRLFLRNTCVMTDLNTHSCHRSGRRVADNWVTMS